MMERRFRAPGFRFHPTDVELILYYLKRKVMGKRLHVEVIDVIDIYKFEPWDLREKSCWKSGDLEWYFFCPMSRKYANGLRANRSTEHGYWKTTGMDKSISHNSQTVGMRKTLVFHEGRPPGGHKTNWVMYEYRLEDKNLVAAGVIQAPYVLCKIFEKSGSGPKNGEQYGAPFREEDWEDDDISNSPATVPIADPSSSSLVQVEEHPPFRKEDDIDLLLSMFDKDDGPAISKCNNANENFADEDAHSEGNAIYDGLPDLGSPSDLKTNGHDFLPFLELNDLSRPLDCATITNGCVTDGTYSCTNDFCNSEGSFDPLCLLHAGPPAFGLSVFPPLYHVGSSQVEDQLPMSREDQGSQGDASHGNEAAFQGER